MRLTQITPFVPCTSLSAQIAFCRDTLGFSVGYQADNHAVLKRDDVAVRLLEVGSGADLHDAKAQQEICNDVDDVDAVFAETERTWKTGFVF